MLHEKEKPELPLLYSREVKLNGKTYIELYHQLYGEIMFYNPKERVFSSTQKGNFPDVTPIDLLNFAKDCLDYEKEIQNARRKSDLPM